MNLLEVIQKVNEFNDEWTIYAEKPWSISSNAVVCLEPEDGSLPEEAKGKAYFLEIFITQDFLESWGERKNKSLEEQCERIIYYAENDA